MKETEGVETRGKVRADKHHTEVENEGQGVKKRLKKDAHASERAPGDDDTLIDGIDDPMEDGNDSSGEDFDLFMEQVKSNLSVEEMKQILRENGPELLCEGSDEDILRRCLDLMYYGPLTPCPGCGGGLEFAGSEYRCPTGYFSAWTKCCYSSTEDHRMESPCKYPAKLHNDFILKCKAESKKHRTRELSRHEKPFSGMTIVLSGRLSRPQGDIKSDIVRYGGTIGRSVKPGVTTCVVASRRDVIGGGSSKLADATEQQTMVVTERWIIDSIEKMQAQPLESYDVCVVLPGETDIPWEKQSLEEEAALSLMAELKIVGKRGIYKDTKLDQEKGVIYEANDILYNCAFSVCDMAVNLNNYAILQLIQLPGNRGLYLYHKEGRVGDKYGVRERLDQLNSPKAAVKEFENIFKQLTGNDFEKWELEKMFCKKPGKYFPLDMAEGTLDARGGGLAPRQIGTCAAHCQLDARLVQFLKILFSQEVYRFAMTEMGIDAPDLPTGNLTELHMETCEEVLVQFAEYLVTNESDEKKREQMCLDFSNKWFTLMHTTRPFVIDNIVQLAEECASTLESVRDIGVASRVIGDIQGDAGKVSDVIGDRYAKLGCEMTVLDREGEDYQMIVKYLNTNMEPISFGEAFGMGNKRYGVVVEDICQLESKAAPSFKDMDRLSNKMLLWCGTRTSNVIRWMNTGVMPAIFEAPVSGYMFGKGVYCTDAACKAAQFGFTSIDRTDGFLMLAVVALGDGVLELTKPKKDVREYETKNTAIKGIGKRTPDPSGHFKWKKNVLVPCGSLQPSKEKNAELDYNEYVVYDTNQTKPVFLVKIQFEVL